MARIKPHIRQRLEALGRERAVLYKTLLLTGLRKSELASITIGQACLDGPLPHVVLEAPDEKNREGGELPLRLDLAADLRAIVAERLATIRADAMRRDEPVPSQLPSDMKLLNVPTGLIRIMDRDLVAAGIARIEVRGGRKVVVKRDARGRTVDVHALRTSFGTHLSKAGVPLRTAQAAMRHSKPELTANCYTDPVLLDVAGAIEMLPKLSLGQVDAPRSRKSA